MQSSMSRPATSKTAKKRSAEPPVHSNAKARGLPQATFVGYPAAMKLHTLSLGVLTIAAQVLASDPVPADLGPTLERMSAAVLAGDADAYLACVHRADPVLLKEQENWAADLAEHTPGSFELSLRDAHFAVQPDGSVVVPIEMTWKMQGLSRRRTVDYTARFVYDDGQWLYAGEQWVRVRAPGVEVLVEPEEKQLGLHIAAVLPSVRRQVDDLMQVHVDRVQQVKVYTSMQHLQQSIYLSYKDPLGGWNEPGESIKMLANDSQSGRAMRILLAHEYGHCATFDLGSQANHMPWWLLEGVAEYCSAHVAGGRSDMQRLVRSWAEKGDLREWDQLADFRGEAMKHQAHVYSQGHHMVAYVANRFGQATLVAWLRAMANGQSLDEATQAALGTTWSSIDTDWRATLPMPAVKKP